MLNWLYTGVKLKTELRMIRVNLYNIRNFYGPAYSPGSGWQLVSVWIYVYKYLALVT